MVWNVLVANIGGFAISAIGVVMYAIGICKDGETPFSGWKTQIGFGLCALGIIFAAIFVTVFGK